MTNIASKQPNMRRDFSDRAELIDYLKAEFPKTTAVDAHTTETLGGRTAAETTLWKFIALNHFSTTKGSST